MQAIEKDGYLFDPPSRRVCPECNGTSWINHYKTIPCKKCKGKGMVPIHYTPEQWVEAGGMLTNDMLVWFRDKIGKVWYKNTFINASQINKNWGDGVKIIIATSAGKPKEK